ncbi:hypothetical protein BLA29_015277 [Euroglyphus maynei]|uniref:Uncharacterized protein n=1 Tax=Euroglyphus maynei TaxID=6958 RepID=A0A1Y3AX41_EURMA|nr:hypothetical protein BLA29_015277 [Euroglyphus maynei]
MAFVTNIIRFYQNPALSNVQEKNLLHKIQQQFVDGDKIIRSVKTEFCFNIEQQVVIMIVMDIKIE